MPRQLIDFVRVSGRQTRTKFLAADDGSWQVSDFQMLESAIKFLPAETCGIPSYVDQAAADRVLVTTKKLDGKTTVSRSTRMKNRYSSRVRRKAKRIPRVRRSVV